jgi:hypothetical protein
VNVAALGKIGPGFAGYPMNHLPLWISNFTEPSSRIVNRSDWQDSSFMTLARLMIS